MKHVKLFEQFIGEEATTSWSKMMKGVKAGGSGPWSLVAIENKKVVAQKIDIRDKNILPAHFEAMRKEYPKAKIHIEDAGGQVVWNESKFNGNISGDAAEYIAKELSHYVKGIINQSNDNVTYFHLKDKSYKGKVIKTLKDVYGLDANDGGNLFSPSPTIVFDNDQILESTEVDEALNPKEFEKAVKDLAYSMPNHTNYDTDGLPSDEQIMKAMQKYQKDLYRHSTSDQKKEAVEMVKQILSESAVNEDKKIDRDAFIALLKDKYKFTFVRTTEDFDGSKGGIWTSGESSPSLGGKKIYNYYSEGSAYELGVLKKFEDAINKLGWYSEWYDTGTMMIWPI